MTGFTGKFINDEIIGLHSFQPVFSATEDAPSKFADSAEVNVFHVSQSFILDDPIVKTLISESNSIFYNLQKLKKRSNDCYLMTSRAYRSAIRTMLNKLQEKIEDDEQLGLDVAKYENFVTIFYSVECLWHLVEILLIDQVSPSIVSGLIEWVSCVFVFLS
jgi:nuclear pore complex protein Nup85